MSDSATTAKPSSQAVKDAQGMWKSFVQISKFSTYFVAATLILLWLIFIGL